MVDSFHALAKRRGLYFPANESYGGVAGLYAYGPTGTALKRNVEAAWRDRFVSREGNAEMDAPTIVPEAVFEASGHLDGFDDAIVACPECSARHRADHLVEDATDIEEAEGLDLVTIEDLIASRDVACPACGQRLAGQPVDSFDLMFETAIGPSGDQSGYLRPETAQSTLVEFPRLAEYARNSLPFGVAQVGRGYRNEISPRNAIVRSREFTMAELQQFFDPDGDDPPLDRVADVTVQLLPADRADDPNPDTVAYTVRQAVDDGVVRPAWLAYYLGVTRQWLDRVGVDVDRLRFREHDDAELAHYATACWDAEACVDGEWIELAGLAYRADYDLARHAEHSDADYDLFREYDRPRERERTVLDVGRGALGPRFGNRLPAVVDALEARADRDPAAFEEDTVTVDVESETVDVDTDHLEVRTEAVTDHGERVRPHVVEPAFGVDRVVYAALHHSHAEDVVDGEARTRLALPAAVAPTDVAVLPLRADVADRARRLVDRLRRADFEVAFDDSGSIGRRYRRQDEVGTPYCVTLDKQTPADDAATVRDRDSTAQARVALADLPEALARLRDGEATVAELRRS
jgi:glycyl-tRNA synthetase